MITQYVLIKTVDVPLGENAVQGWYNSPREAWKGLHCERSDTPKLERYKRYTYNYVRELVAMYGEFDLIKVKVVRTPDNVEAVSQSSSLITLRFQFGKLKPAWIDRTYRLYQENE